MINNCYVIAEAGVNHNGDPEMARELIRVAASSGADAVKFQSFKAEEVSTDKADKADYQVLTTGAGSQKDLLSQLELSVELHGILSKEARGCGISFASTAFDVDSLETVLSLDCPFLKIPSGEITNRPLVEAIAAAKRPVILSTGMSTLEEVKMAVAWLGDGPRASDRLPALTILHCVTDYPAAIEDQNLRCIQEMSKTLDLPTGYSDHSDGIIMPMAAVALGASVIEKHFTLDRSLPGPDHRASLEPVELSTMVKAIRDVTAGLGDGKKRPMPSEMKNRALIRKSIVASRSIEKGETFSVDNLTVKRPGTGVSPAYWYDVLGAVAACDYAPDDMIEFPE